MSFAASDSTSTWQGGIKEREDGEKVWGDDYSRKAINQGTAVIRGNTVLLLYRDCTYLARTKILSMLGTGSLLAEVSHFSFHFCLVARDFCYNQLQKCCDDLSCFKSLLVTGLWDIILTSLVPPIQSCSSKFWAWSCIASNFDKGWRGDHKHKIMDRPFMPNYGVVSQVLLQLVVAGKVLGTFWKSQKLILSGKNQWVVISKISFRKTEKITNAQKMNSRKNFVPHGMPT